MDIELRRKKIREYDSKPENKFKKKIYMAKYRFEYERLNKKNIRDRKKEYYKKNKDKIDKRKKEWMKNNPEKWKAYFQRYYKKNKDKIVAYGSDWERKMKIESENFAIRKALRSRLKQAFKNYSKFGKTNTSDKYGVDYDAIIEHLKPFPKDRSLYHIDHILPCCSFDLTDLEQVKKCFTPENHQWLLIKDNLQKISSDKKQSLRLGKTF